MKKWRGRQEDVISDENIQYAANVVLHNSHDKDKDKIALDPEWQAALKKSIINGTYRRERDGEIEIYEPNSRKYRTLNPPTTKTKVVEQMIHGIFLQQIIRYLHPNACASVPDRGIERARKIVKGWTHLPRRQRKYYVQGDIRQFFPSIRRDVAMREYERHIGDKRVLDHIRRQMPNEVGLPLGSPLTQTTANLLLTRFDYICDSWGNGYVRYQDDFVVLFSSKKKARKFIEFIVPYLKDNYDLDIKTTGRGAIQVWKWADRDINIAGYKTSFTGCQKIRRHTYLRARRLLNLKSYSVSQARAAMALKGWVDHSDCIHLQAEFAKKSNKLTYIISKGA